MSEDGGVENLIHTKATRVDNPKVSSLVQINVGEVIGWGNEGTVRRANVVSQQAPGMNVQLAYKGELTDIGLTKFETTIEGYKAAKEAGLPVPHTFRETEDKKGFLITDLTEGGKNVVLSTNDVNTTRIRQLYSGKNSEVMKKFAHNEHITSDKITQQLQQYISLAARANLYLPPAAWFIIISPDGSYKFIIGDCGDIMRSSDRGKDSYHQRELNNKSALTATRRELLAIQTYGRDPERALRMLVSQSSE